MEKLVDKKSAAFNPDPGDYVDAALEWAFDAIKLFPKKKKHTVNFIAEMTRTVTSYIVNYISGYKVDIISFVAEVIDLL